jgi:hypothetical protein
MTAKITQKAAFAEIRALGFTVRKTEFGDYRVADASQLDLAKREAGAAYCSDLQEALDNARYVAAAKAAPAPAPADIPPPANVIDCTPTWSAIIPLLRMAIENGSAKGQAIAWEEIARMAALADERNALAAAMSNLLDVMSAPASRKVTEAWDAARALIGAR